MRWKRFARWFSENWAAVQLMDAYDVDDYLASRNFKSKPPRRPWLSKRAQAKRWRKDQKRHDKAMDWAYQKLDREGFWDD